MVPRSGRINWALRLIANDGDFGAAREFVVKQISQKFRVSRDTALEDTRHIRKLPYVEMDDEARLYYVGPKLPAIKDDPRVQQPEYESTSSDETPSQMRHLPGVALHEVRAPADARSREREVRRATLAAKHGAHPVPIEELIRIDWDLGLGPTQKEEDPLRWREDVRRWVRKRLREEWGDLIDDVEVDAQAIMLTVQFCQIPVPVDQGNAPKAPLVPPTPEQGLVVKRALLDASKDFSEAASHARVLGVCFKQGMPRETCEDILKDLVEKEIIEKERTGTGWEYYSSRLKREGRRIYTR